jgi:DNA-binding HxlR family transcriptional regulator
VAIGRPRVALCYHRFMSASPGVPERRLYPNQQGCPIARTLDVIGDRWTLLILRDLLIFNRTRFSEFLASLDGLSPNLLSQRLKQLEQDGLVERHLYSDHPPRMEYRPTEKGEALRPALEALATWGNSFRPR